MNSLKDENIDSKYIDKNNLFDYFYYLSTEELTKLIFNAKSEEEEQFYFLISNYISKIQQKKAMEEESYK